MRSAIYEGTLRHRRVAEREHAFSHRLAMAYVDLDETDTVLGGRLTKRGAGLMRFRRSDYYGDPAVPLADAVRALVRDRTGTDLTGPVRMLTNLRVLGHCFNPVTFYYCFAPDGERLETVVAEVTNTPWGERHAYVVSDSFAKELHVSPFMGMDQHYKCTTPEPGASLTVHMQNIEGAARVFDATLRLDRRPFDAATVRRVSWRYPLASRRVLLFIYVHALVLRLKGVRVKHHPGAVTP